MFFNSAAMYITEECGMMDHPTVIEGNRQSSVSIRNAIAAMKQSESNITVFELGMENCYTLAFE